MSYKDLCGTIKGIYLKCQKGPNRTLSIHAKAFNIKQNMENMRLRLKKSTKMSIKPHYTNLLFKQLNLVPETGLVFLIRSRSAPLIKSPQTRIERKKVVKVLGTF